jgi:hypothetical protein
MDKKISVETFMAQEKAAGRVSVLEPWRDDVLYLKQHGYTQKQILDFLALNGVSVAQTTLNSFIRSRSVKEKPRNDAVQIQNRNAKHTENKSENNPPLQETERDALPKSISVGKKRFKRADEIDISELI